MSLLSGILILTRIQLRPLATIPKRGMLDTTSITCHINLTKLLRPLYPGQAPTIRRNMYNVVLVFDLARLSSLRFITNTLSLLIDRSFPVRLGIVPIVETDEGVKMAKMFYYLVQNYGRRATMGFFSSVRTICFASHYSHSYTLDPRSVRRQEAAGLDSCANGIRSTRRK
jgi:Thioredoxin-like domain